MAGDIRDRQGTARTRPTLRTLAADTGFAVATVSRALAKDPKIAESTRQTVAEAAERLGYVPDRAAQRLRTGRTNVISFILEPHDEMLAFGSMMIAGLIQDDVRQTVNGMPGLMKLPVLGTLFRSRSFERNETELVVLVTPYLSRPAARTALAKPDDNFNPPSDGAGMFLGRVNRVYGTMKTDRPKGRYHGVVGYIYK